MTVTINGATGETTPGTTFTGSTSGTILVQAASVAGTNTVTLPAGTGTAAVQGVSTNIVSGTSQASTSGTSIDFTAIPSWVKRITVMFNGVSLSGSSQILIQLGAGSPTTSGYTSGSTRASVSGVNGVAYTTGFGFNMSGAADVLGGLTTIATLGSNIWVAAGNCTVNSSSLYMMTTTGNVTLSGTLDRVRITSVNGTDTFDAGSINILYE